MNTVKLLKIHTIQIENSIIITIEYNIFPSKYKLSQQAYSIVIISSQLIKNYNSKGFAVAETMPSQIPSIILFL